uniref:Uncharacterized protein n=1 Tax=Chromera velia CCMP2878 TaxID=1169474 RepID=A0A0G4HS70_9ALVE|eukprot:Cvel_30906.t1-p1 / transcript=Cvel_30906.t1 / gene=Cvel_30906 / organism=Chromera_velia_CCMP2878 / gene_product=hypothetical protein / transcript_product=hypothetical protein / location=Cvel_scaffold4495:6442-6960(+) / protein_length=173 / sequence_SO=supercontig / SO=protein_coding / is_pseudo=false
MAAECDINSPCSRLRAGAQTRRVGRLSGKAKETGFESMSHLVKEAGRVDDPTLKDVLAQWAMEIESATLETSTKSQYEVALRLIEKSNPWLLLMRGVLDVKMGFAHQRGKKANEIGLLRGAVKWWHHREGHPPPLFEDPSLAYFFTGLKKLADNTVKEKKRLSREEIGKIIDW